MHKFFLQKKCRLGIMFFLAFFACCCDSLVADYSIESSTYKLQMDQRTGSFSLLSIRSNVLIPLFKDRNDPFSSFAGIVINGKMIPLGGFQGRCGESRVDGNMLYYCWMFHGINVEQKIKLVRDENSEIIDWSWRFAKKNGKPMGFILVLDPVEAGFFSSDSHELILKAQSKYFQILPTLPPAGCAMIEDWGTFKKDVRRSFSSLRGIKMPTSGVIGFYWEDIGFGKETGIGVRMKEIFPCFDPEQVVVSSVQPVVISSNDSEITVSISNGTIMDLHQATLHCIPHPAIRISSSENADLGKITAVSGKRVPFIMSSLSLMEQADTVSFELEYSADGKQYVKTLNKDVLLKKSGSVFDAEFVHDEAGSRFSLVQPVGVFLSNRRLEITDQDDKIVKAFPLKPDGKLVEWDGADENGFPTVKGVAYFYCITGTVKDTVFHSPKKSFVTEPDVIETASGFLFRFPAINFGYDNAAIRSSAYPILKKIAIRIKESHLTKTIKINGYTDKTGTKTKNMKLSMDRATVVRDYFIGAEGFQESNFIVKGFADEDPVAANDSEENKAKNRRVEIFIEK